jgi:protocatechuate 3,4-dioxygenase beta subunit
VFDQGLGFDLETLVDRRRVLRMIGMSAVGIGLGGIAACGDGTSSVTTTGAATATTSVRSTAGGDTTVASGDGSESCEVIPEETAGPYPGDGSNGPDVLAESGAVRSDITTSFGDYSGTAEGVPIAIEFELQDLANGCAPFAGAAVYAWHCTRDGEYSLYTLPDQNYLRGAQSAGDDGVVRFTSIFPGCYSGRWPHVHFEVFPDLAAAGDDPNKVATSQIALPEDICSEVYATSGYESSLANLSRVSLASDNVFGDDEGVRQLGTITGSVADGLTVRLVVSVGA